MTTTEENPVVQRDINMTNKLGVLRRDNLLAWMSKKSMSAGELVQISGISKGTFSKCFGGTVQATAPSKKTMAKLYAAFEELEEGSLDKGDFNPATEAPPAPVTAEKEDIFIQVGRLKTPVSESMAKRVLIMIALDG